MAQVFKTYVNLVEGTVYRFSGETVAVEGQTYVKRKFLSELQPVDGWHPTEHAADAVAAIEVQKRISLLTATAAELLRPLPAGVAADSSATGGAHAGVAT